MRDRSKALFGALVGNLDSQALVPVIALYALALGADLLMVGLIVGAYSIAHAPANVLFGHVVDRMGRRRTLVAGLLADAGSLVLYAVSQNPLHLLAARIVHGVGGGLTGPATLSFVAGTAALGRQGRSMAVYGITLGIAVILGFGMAGGIVLASGDVLTAVPRLAFILIAFLLAGALVGSTLAEPSPVRRVRWSEASALLRRAPFLAGLTLILALYFAVGSFVTLFPPHVLALGGEGAESVVVVSFLGFAVASVILHYPAGIVADRAGPRRVAVVGLAALASGFLLLPFAVAPLALAASLVLLGTGHAFVFPAATAVVSAASPTDRLGFATGVLYALLVAGVAIGAPLMAFVAGVTGVPVAIALTSLATVPALAVTSFVPHTLGEIAPSSTVS